MGEGLEVEEWKSDKNGLDILHMVYIIHGVANLAIERRVLKTIVCQLRPEML
jgi:hypothetical protein